MSFTKIGTLDLQKWQLDDILEKALAAVQICEVLVSMITTERIRNDAQLREVYNKLNNDDSFAPGVSRANMSDIPIKKKTDTFSPSLFSVRPSRSTYFVHGATVIFAYSATFTTTSPPPCRSRKPNATNGRSNQSDLSQCCCINRATMLR